MTVVARPVSPELAGWHALWTLLLFVGAVTWHTGGIATVLSALWGPVIAVIVGAISAVSAFAISASVGGIVTGLLGVPLLFVVSALLRRNQSVVAQASGAAAAGGVSALVAVGAYLALYGSGAISAEVLGDPIPDATWPIAGALVAIATASSAGGWLIASLQQRGRGDRNTVAVRPESHA